MGLGSWGARVACVAVVFCFAACSDTPGGGGVETTDAQFPDLGTTGGGGGTDADTGVPDPNADGGTNPNPNGDGGSTMFPDVGAPPDPTLDSDCDGLSDLYELSTIYPDGQRTNPNVADTDGDGLLDGLEAGVTGPVAGSNCPAVPTDGDPTSRTRPTQADSDGDGIVDGTEDANRNGRVDPGETDPNLRDSDGDRIPDGIEDANRNGQRDPGELNPTLRDTDMDGIGDGVEDANANGTLDPGETNPLSTDTDGDGVLDGDEDTNHDGVRQPYEIDPRSADTDCDGVADGDELMLGTSPLSADSDGDGVPDGVELGRATPVAGTNCPGFVPDADGTTTTNPLDDDSDGDGVPDGLEDVNMNGRVDPGETNPGNPDTDGDGFSDGDEVLIGSDPLDPTSPDPALGAGVLAVCADANLTPVTFHNGPPGGSGAANWTFAARPAVTYAPIAVTNNDVHVATLDEGPAGISGFVLSMPEILGTSITAETAALSQRLANAAGPRNLMLSVRQSGRNITSHDGFDASVSNVLDVDSGSVNASGLRNLLLEAVTGLPAATFPGLSTNTGAAGTAWTVMYQVLLRPAENKTYIVLALVNRPAFDNLANIAAIRLADLSGGTALAQKDARRGKGCDPFVAQGQSVADFIWMADISASTDDDRGRIVSAAEQVFAALTANNVDFRMAVVPHSQSRIHRPGDAGHMRGTGFTRSRTVFTQHLQNVTDTDGCEFGIDSVDATIARALPRSLVEQADKIRQNATLAVVYVSDENAQTVEQGPCWDVPAQMNCPTGIGDVFTDGLTSCSEAPDAAERACVDQILRPYIQRLQSENAIAFGQVFADSPLVDCNQGHLACPMSAQDRNEPGRGYIEVINATGGLFYSPCEANPGMGPLRAIVDAVSGAASQFQLNGAPIASTIKVGITPVGTTNVTIVPRSRSDGFDYDPASNSIFFRGSTHRPGENDRVTVSYRVWQPPRDPCGPCAQNQVCDPVLGVCTCDQAVCNNCGPNEACNADCQCACTSDCNGNCGPGQVCNQNTCQCECAPDCGGCPTGTACNQNTCACECAGDCGGACVGTPLTCNPNDCNCQCDCAGRCDGGALCNPLTCACECAPDCNQRCGRNQVCNPANGCACECPSDCGGCGDGTICNQTTCECECAPNCADSCTGNQVCNPNNSCICECPADCGGCGPNEQCNASECRCIPIV